MVALPYILSLLVLSGTTLGLAQKGFNFNEKCSSNNRCPGNARCCGLGGYCGSDDSFCGRNCNRDGSFQGKCINIDANFDSNGRCGQGNICPSHAPCCTQEGFCGRGEDYCKRCNKAGSFAATCDD
ncbi:hypothetical protein BGZ63DRAFT_67282 [Mariannaea sp. PMI_226]|nr:hypothetical protein BGZ63DRAFT_67282 [Mariannaea sp. PMI_226]